MRTSVTKTIIECDVCHLVLNDVSEVALAIMSVGSGDCARIARVAEKDVLIGLPGNFPRAELCPRCALALVQELANEFDRRSDEIRRVFQKWFKEPVVRGIHIPGIAGLEHP